MLVHSFVRCRWWKGCDQIVENVMLYLCETWRLLSGDELVGRVKFTASEQTLEDDALFIAELISCGRLRFRDLFLELSASKDQLQQAPIVDGKAVALARQRMIGPRTNA